jgi:hypothetical protein
MEQMTEGAHVLPLAQGHVFEDQYHVFVIALVDSSTKGRFWKVMQHSLVEFSFFLQYRLHNCEVQEL